MTSCNHVRAGNNRDRVLMDRHSWASRLGPVRMHHCLMLNSSNHLCQRNTSVNFYTKVSLFTWLVNLNWKRGGGGEHPSPINKRRDE